MTGFGLLLLLIVGIYGALFWLRRPGAGGSLGQAIRASDHDAWRDAVQERERKLKRLREQEPRT